MAMGLVLQLPLVSDGVYTYQSWESLSVSPDQLSVEHLKSNLISLLEEVSSDLTLVSRELV